MSKHVMWIDHLSLLAENPSVQVSFNAVSSGVGSGLSGLVVQSTTIGDTAAGGQQGCLDSTRGAPRFKVTGVRVCYENSNPRTFIDQVRLAQV